MSSNRVPLVNDVEHYERALQMYRKCNGNREALQDWIEIRLHERLIDMFGEKKNLRILAYDPDETALYFLKETIRCAQKQHHNDFTINCHVVAPNTSRYRELASREVDLGNVTFEWFNGNFGAFVDEFKTREDEKRKFDVVHFFRGFYDVDSAETLADSYENLLIRDGIVTVVGEDKDSFWYKMMHFLARNKTKHEFFKCSGNISEAYFLSGWLAQAREKGWAYHSYVRDCDFHVTPLRHISGGNDVNYLLDFLFQMKDARSKLSSDVIRDFMELLRKEERDVQGRKYFPNKFGAIVITKE